MSLINVENLKLGYDGKCVVEGITFTVNEGDYLCIVGENGSGKTTLIKGLLGLIGKLGGTLEYADVLSKNHIGYLSQRSEHMADFPASVREIVMSGFLNNRSFGFRYSAFEKQTAEKVMAQVGISSIQKKNFSSLSGGQQQRVLLARALCATKKLILLDEPTSALDPIATSEFYSLVKSLNKNGITVIMVSHDVTAAVRNASHILCLSQAENFYGTTHEFMHSETGRRMLVSDCPCDDCQHLSCKEVRFNA
ncbi:MAG: metal ABC transporter ATP-binding protein [Ruminococcus sp.]|nr:metal ABC transporter ATP-binding protein [Ruminococcus sp.]